MTTTWIGQPVSRVDGRQKVTGGATYAAEFDQCPGLVHGVIVRSTIASGRIAGIDSAAAERAPGVARRAHASRTRLTSPIASTQATSIPAPASACTCSRMTGSAIKGQPIALVIAATLEQAAHAATLVRVSYAPEAAVTDITHVKPVPPASEDTDDEERPSGTRRGDPEEALAGCRGHDR